MTTAAAEHLALIAAGLAAFAATISAAARMIGHRQQGALKSVAMWTMISLYQAAVPVFFILAGLTSPLHGALLAGAWFAVFLAVGRPWHGAVLRQLPRIVASPAIWLWSDLHSISGRATARSEPRKTAAGRHSRRGVGNQAPATVGEAHEQVQRHLEERGVPALMDDPALEGGPEISEITSEVPIPSQWAELVAFVINHEPDTDEEQREFTLGNAAGMHALAEAFNGHAELLLNGVGLDPVVVGAHVEVAEAVGECAAKVALADRRCAVVYQAIHEHVDGGGTLPYRGAWFDGRTDGPTEASTDGEAAA